MADGLVFTISVAFIFSLLFLYLDFSLMNFVLGTGLWLA